MTALGYVVCKLHQHLDKTTVVKGAHNKAQNCPKFLLSAFMCTDFMNHYLNNFSECISYFLGN